MKSFCLVLLCCLFTGPLQAKELHAKSILNQPAPALTVEKWLTPQPKTEGKFVIIDFWATWCPDCRHAIPELNEWQKKYADKLVVIGISDEPESKVKDLPKPKPDYASAIDTTSHSMKTALAVREIPHLLVIDPKGIVRWEGFPFHKGAELTEKVLTDIFAKYSH